MKRDRNIIHLEPKQPFSWTVVVSLVLAWGVVLGLALFLKFTMVRLLLPLIALILVIYLAVCTYYYLKNQK